MTSHELQRSKDWTEPGTYEVAEGVYRIPLPLPNDHLKAVNVYAIVNENSLTLVDSGWALIEARDALAGSLRALGAQLGDVEQFLVTHIHRDHYTQAIALRREFGTPVKLGDGERLSLEALASSDFAGLPRRFAMLRSHDAGEVVDRLIEADVGNTNSRTNWETPDGWLHNGQEIQLQSRTLKVVNTPGHTRGHVVFVDEIGGLLFAGDHVLPHITPSIGVEAAPSILPLGNYLDSLRTVRAMPDMRLLPAHGPVMAGMHERIDQILDHHDDRLRKTLVAVASGPTSAGAVARELLWTGRGRAFATLDPSNQMLAVLETVAHLDLLQVQGRLVSRVESGIILFEPTFGDEKHS